MQLRKAARPGTGRCLRAKWQDVFQQFPEISLIRLSVGRVKVKYLCGRFWNLLRWTVVSYGNLEAHRRLKKTDCRLGALMTHFRRRCWDDARDRSRTFLDDRVKIQDGRQNTHEAGAAAQLVSGGKRKRSRQDGVLAT